MKTGGHKAILPNGEDDPMGDGGHGQTNWKNFDTKAKYKKSTLHQGTHTSDSYHFTTLHTAVDLVTALKSLETMVWADLSQRFRVVITLTLSMAKLPMKKKLPRVKVNANLCGLKTIVGRPITNARAKKTTDSSNASTKP